MDVLLEYADEYLLDRAYAYMLPYPKQPSSFDSSYALANASSSHPSSSYSFDTPTPPTSLLARDNIYRQIHSIFWLAWIGSFILYFTFSSLSYYLVFDHRLKHHPRFLKNQVWREIKMSLIAMPTIDVLTIPWFLGEVRGHSLLYDRVDEYGWAWLGVSTVLYMLFNDVMIYWIHRLEHHKSIYKYIHKRESAGKGWEC